MDLDKLYSRLKKIPFDRWTRERSGSWNNYKTVIKGHKISIGILYPQHYTDDTKIELAISSKNGEKLLGEHTSTETFKIAMELEKVYEERLRNENYKSNIKRKDDLQKLLEDL